MAAITLEKWRRYLDWVQLSFEIVPDERGRIVARPLSHQERYARDCRQYGAAAAVRLWQERRAVQLRIDPELDPDFSPN